MMTNYSGRAAKCAEFNLNLKKQKNKKHLVMTLDLEMLLFICQTNMDSRQPARERTRNRPQVEAPLYLCTMFLLRFLKKEKKENRE